MGRGLRCLAAIGLSAAGFAAFGPGAALAGTLDQQQPDGTAAFPPVNELDSSAQTFTAGVTGGLDEVDLDISTTSATFPLTVEIRNVSAGVPGTTPLASGSVPIFPDIDHAFTPIQFATPAQVVAGTQYAIVAYTADTSSWGWGHSVAANPYPTGGAFTVGASPPSGTWLPDPYDLAFKTYVVPSAATVAPTGQRAAALKKCKKKHSHKKRKKCKKKANLLPV